MSDPGPFDARTWLYVPGDRPDRMPKALAAGADAVILDLEDAVAQPAKGQARQMVTEFLASCDRSGPAVWVRVNNTPELLADDMSAAVTASASGIVLPRAEDPTQLASVVGIAAGLPIMALVESGAGVWNARDVLATAGVGCAAIGEADLSADLGVPFADDSPALLHARIQVVMAAAAAGVHPPVGPVTVNFKDVDAFVASCVDLAQVGFEGRQVIHPAQVGPANAAFTPAAADVAAAQELLDGFAAAEADGVGVYLDDNGRMVDLAVIKSAQRLVARAALAN